MSSKIDGDQPLVRESIDGLEQIGPLVADEFLKATRRAAMRAIIDAAEVAEAAAVALRAQAADIGEAGA